VNVGKTKTVGRRTFLGALGAGAGLALVRPPILESLVGSQSNLALGELNISELLKQLDQTLTPVQRKHTFLNADHPVRQITNTVAIHKGPHIGTLFNTHQQALIHEMYRRMLSSQGRAWFKNTTALEGKFEGSSFKIYQTPGAESQVVINGGHYMLRAQGNTALLDSAYAFGGPIAYGQQLGNHQYQVEGNAFKAHGDAINAVHQAMNQSELAQAYQLSPPSELLTQIQGPAATPPGLKIGVAREPVQELMRHALTTLFAAYPEVQQRDAWSAIDNNGGLNSLHLALYQDYGFYQDGARATQLTPAQRHARELPYIQVWRLEGPASVIHFQGYPHVHAYINVVRDPERVAIGEVLNKTSVAFDEASTHALLNAAIQSASGEPVSFYPNKVLGRLSPGQVSTGSLYALDPFNNSIIITTIRREKISPSLIASIAAQGVAVTAGQTVRVATTDYMLARPDLFGEPESVQETGVSVRAALIDRVRDQDISGFVNHA